MGNKTYKDYFNINPKYYAAVTADLIKSGEVKWDAFYPHETFVKLLEKTHIMLSGKDSRSLWVEGAYGTGKSHAVLTVKSLLEASDDEIRAYFKEYGLRDDLCQKIITDKSNGRLITIHRIGSASIRSDQDLILAMQDSIMASLHEHGIKNRGEASLKDSAIKWFEEKEANRIYFDSLIQEDKYMWDFGGRHVDEVIHILKDSDDEDAVSKMMKNILKVAEDNGITALRLDVPAMCEWIKSILDTNDISAILFVWDEFTEYFVNNPNSLTGFQTLAEISQSHPFYFLIVTHESSSLIRDKDMRRKILNRFVGDVTVRIEMPENMAFRLMAQAMKATDDPVLLPEWEEYKEDLNSELTGVRNTIIANSRKNATMGQKTVISDEELQSIVPIHPYAALLLKHMSVAFNSNARSMFDFIISNDMTEAKGFKWFINKYGPLDSTNLLTIDMLWDFFTGKDQNGLNDDVRVILDSFSLLKKDSLTPDQERVFKTVLLLEAISQRVSDVELLRPNEQNIDLAFNGTDWAKGKGRSIAAALCQQGFLFEKPVGNGLKEYTVANNGSDRVKIEKLKTEIKDAIKTQDLIISAELMSAVQLPVSIRQRFVMEGAACANFTQVTNKVNEHRRPNRFNVVVSFALNDDEAALAKSAIMKTIVQPSNELFYIESLVPMGTDLFTQYVENMAYSKNYTQNDRQRAMGFENQAKKCLMQWKQNISNGAFILYTPENKSGIRVANLPALQDELRKINHQIYYCGLEQFNVNENMFMKGPLAQGAECGIAEELKHSFKSTNIKTSLATALEGAWQVANYWEDPTKKSLPIVRIKQKVECVIKEGFSKASGRISILAIYEALEEAPYGLMPSNITAFVMGFVLKEYANSDYFWSNGFSSESMNLDKMKQMIANAINQKFSPTPKYKEEFIVEMSASQRSFLQCTSAVFNIPMAQCGSVESARDQVRVKMKGLTFPIWCVKSILKEVQLESDIILISTVIDAYCGIANTANSNKATESDLAEQIGNIINENKAVIGDLKCLLTNDMCRKGMLAYIESYQGGILKDLATEIGDNGAYLDQVKHKFNADAANWVWNPVTADEKISDVILEYRIIAESNKSLLPKCISMRDVVGEWNKRSNNIKIPYDVLRKYAGDLNEFLVQLYYMKQSGQLQEQNKQKFYDVLITQREAFEKFYKDQLPYFKQAADMFIEGMEEQDVVGFYSNLPTGQFTKSSTEYYQYIEKKVEDYLKNLKKEQLKKIWKEKTGTKDPVDWSARYDTPILCMFDDVQRANAKAVFETICAFSASDVDITKAINYLQNASFYDRLNDSVERDKCFMERVVGDYSIMLKSADKIRRSLAESIGERAYDWMDNSTVKNKLRVLAEKEYKLSGCERAQAVIDKMDASELRRYLNDLISDNLNVGMEILRNE